MKFPEGSAARRWAVPQVFSAFAPLRPLVMGTEHNALAAIREFNQISKHIRDGHLDRSLVEAAWMPVVISIVPAETQIPTEGQ